MKTLSGNIPNSVFPRRDFFKIGGVGLAATSLALPAVEAKPTKTPESLVKILYDSLNEKQRKVICFDWNYVDKKRGLLRTRIENNWKITNPTIDSSFYTADQKALIHEVFLGMTNPDWHQGWARQLKDDLGGFGKRQSIAIFGKPGTSLFEFVLASRHMTLRCDGNSAEHVAFGGPILYAHEGERIYEKAHHPNNVFWHQAKAANKLYDMFDGKQRDRALVLAGMPSEEMVGFRGPKGRFQGIGVSDFSADQKTHLQSVLKLLIEPFRKSDQDEVVRCLAKQGGLDACNLAFYKEGDIGKDGVYDNWRLEGPSFVWYFRGKPHVHVWVNVADTHKVELNSFQNSVGV